MDYLHRTLKLLSPHEWGQYEVETINGGPATAAETEWKTIPIVGSQHMGVEPRHLDVPITIIGEPDNPHDDTALLVRVGQEAIGYIPKASKHWFGSVHPRVWNARLEGFYLVNDGEWNVKMGVPKCWSVGYYDYNAGHPPGRRHDLFGGVRDRNSWLAGYEAAKAYGDMLS